MSTEVLEQLESRVERAVQFLSRVKEENENLQEEIRQLKRDLEEVTRERRNKDQLIGRLRLDRSRVKSKVEKILERVIALEQPSQS